MPNRAHQSNTQRQIKKKSEPNSPIPSIAAHHGHLLSLPSESLTQITAWLDPKSLLAFGRVNRQLRDHVADDHTWGIAFKARFLKLSPEVVPSQTDLLLLRRSETSWRKEFLSRWNLNRRLVKSRNAAISHTPVNSTVSDVILLPDKSSVVASSLAYGIASRSFAFTGKVLKGYLDAHGTFNGQGVGNPNGEFAPDVSAIRLHSAGGSAAKIAWGFLNGDVALTAAPKVMELGKTTRFTRCRPADAHESMISTLTFGEVQGALGSTLVSASTRGSIKLWETRRMKCLWTESIQDAYHSTTTQSGSMNAILGVKCLSYCENSSVIAAVASNGDIFVWAGFDTQQATEASQTSDAAVFEPILPRYCGRFASPQSSKDCEPLSVTVQPSRAGSLDVHIAVFYTHSSYFWKLVASPSLSRPNTLEISATKFTAGVVGELTSSFINFANDPRPESTTQAAPPPLRPILPHNMGGLVPPQPRRSPLGSRHRSYVVAGDAVGQLVLWDWDADSACATRRQDGVEQQACRQMLAHEDGALSAIGMNGPVLATGSNGGTIKLWDSLTFEHIRTFTAPSVRFPRDPDHERVSRLILLEDVMIASLGDRVLAWKAVVTNTDKTVKTRGKKPMRARANPMSKWQEQAELRRELGDSRSEIDDDVQEAHGREREQRQRLAQLGLDEVEAVEYVLMLSRDEEIANQASLPSSVGEGGSFANTGMNQTHATDIANLEDDLLFDMTDDFDVSFPSPSPSRLVPSKHEQDKSLSTSAPTASSGRASVSQSYITSIPSPRHTPYLAPISYSPTGSTKIQVSPRQKPEPMEAGLKNVGLSMSPLSIGRSNVWQTPSHPSQGGSPSLGNVVGCSRSVPASMEDWIPSSTPPRASTCASSTSSRASSSVSSLSHAMTSTAGQRSWSDVARSSLSISNQSGHQPPTSSLTTGSRAVQERHPSRSLLSARLTTNQRPVAFPSFDSEDAELQYVLQLSLAEAKGRDGTE